MCDCISKTPQQSLATVFTVVAVTTLLITTVAVAILLTPTIVIPVLFVPALIGAAGGSGFIALITSITSIVLFASKERTPLQPPPSRPIPGTPFKTKAPLEMTSPDQRIVTAMSDLLTFKANLPPNCTATKTVKFLSSTYLSYLPDDYQLINSFKAELVKANNNNLTVDELIKIQKNIIALIPKNDEEQEKEV